MARSPLTLAASVTSALPRVGVVGVGILTEGAAGRYDSALAELDDGRRVVVRAPVDAEAAPELAAEARALRALTPGVRGLLPFRAPELLGETGLGDARAVVVDFLPGYRVDAAHLPSGRGAASSIGEALAALHALPASIVRTEGLPFRTPAQVREDVSRLLDRVELTRSAPPRLLERWRRAVQTDELWRFESAVVLGGAGAASFLFEDVDAVPVVTGVLDWHGLSVGDPATDLQWLASAPAAAEDVHVAYVAHSGRAPDALVRERARLYAELEFAKWLVHGSEARREDIIEDAVTLLESLAAGVRDEDIVPASALGVDDAIALLDRVPDSQSAPVDTSMHTDAYDPAELALWLSDEDDVAGEDSGDDGVPDPTTAAAPHDDVSTAPVEISAWAQRPRTAAQANGTTGAETADAQADAERSSDAALRRWLSD
ncbi:phosphotransferase [Microbacterium terregens]|jgi:aminoglycoside phosphotransferase (APT) family kinase protein|uniref:Phosphotransferase n=1 Tax=Microbacterium terregens TaxID=69363 RepID=A0ABV5SXP3_9MICO